MVINWSIFYVKNNILAFLNGKGISAYSELQTTLHSQILLLICSNNIYYTYFI